jgi:NodT family efflux transporter outer membrane factor (OMF) lipoprotein
LNRTRLLLLLSSPFLLLSLASCAAGPDYEPPAVTMPEVWAGTGAPGGRAITDADPGDLSRWWSRFEDPALVELVELALSQSPDLAEAAGRLLEARFRRAAVAGERVPAIDLDAGYSRTRQSGTIGDAPVGGFAIDPEADLWTAGASLTWELDVFGRIGRRVEAADRTTEAELADFYAVQVSLAAEVALAYTDGRELQNRLRIAEENARIQQSALDLARTRFEAGLTTRLDVDQAESALRQTLSRIPALKAQLQQAKNRLSLLTGRVPGAADDALAEVVPVPTPPDSIAAGAPADLLRRRPDVIRAERELGSSVASFAAARADLYPRFTLVGNFGFASDDVEDLFDWDSRVFGIGPAVDWPIFQGGTLRALASAERAVVDQRAAAYQRTILVALQEVADAAAAFARNREQRAELTLAVAAAERAVRFAQAQYEQGLVDFDRVLDTQRSLFVSQEELAVVDAAVTAEAIRLYRALGGGWDAPTPASTTASTTRPTSG